MAQGKTNFFEKRVGEYAKSGVGIDSTQQVRRHYHQQAASSAQATRSESSRSVCAYLTMVMPGLLLRCSHWTPTSKPPWASRGREDRTVRRGTRRLYCHLSGAEGGGGREREGAREERPPLDNHRMAR